MFDKSSELKVVTKWKGSARKNHQNCEASLECCIKFNVIGTCPTVYKLCNIHKPNAKQDVIHPTGCQTTSAPGARPKEYRYQMITTPSLKKNKVTNV